MKLTDILSEGISPTVYHFTHSENILSILQQNKIRMRPYVGRESEVELGKNKKLFFLSTARSKRGGYTQAAAGYGILVLDGRKLGQKYKGSPIEYWGSDMRRVDRERTTTEMEDRIYGDRPEIPNANKYIKEIHIFVNNPEDSDDKQKRRIRAIMLAAKKRNVDTYFYTNANDFLNQNKRKSLKFDVSTLKTPATKSGGYSGRISQMVKKHLGPVAELINAPINTKRLSDKARKLKYDIVFLDRYHDDIANKLGNDISSNSKDNLPIVNNIVLHMQKHNMKRPMDLVKWLQKKWKEEEGMDEIYKR